MDHSDHDDLEQKRVELCGGRWPYVDVECHRCLRFCAKCQKKKGGWEGGGADGHKLDTVVKKMNQLICGYWAVNRDVSVGYLPVCYRPKMRKYMEGERGQKKKKVILVNRIGFAPSSHLRRKNDCTAGILANNILVQIAQRAIV